MSRDRQAWWTGLGDQSVLCITRAKIRQLDGRWVSQTVLVATSLTTFEQSSCPWKPASW
jgi:hypothetical protein